MPTPQFPPADAAARAELIEWIRQTPLVYGPWQNFKRLYKDAEAAFNSGTREPEVLAALLARFDAQPLDKVKGDAAIAGNFGLMHFRDGYAYILSENNALQAFDLSAPMQPKLTASLPIDLTFSYYGNEFKFAAGHLWLQNGANLWAFDLSEPAEPKWLGLFETQAQHALFAGDNIITFTNTGENALRVMQLRGEELVVVGACDMTLGEDYSYVNQMTVEANVVSLQYYSYGGRNHQYFIQTIDVSDPTNPRVTGTTQTNGRAQNDTAYTKAGEYGLAIGRDKLRLLDVSNPQKPRELSKIKVAGARNIVGNDALAVVSCYEWNQSGQHNTLRFVDLSKPKSLRLLGELDVGDLGNMELYGGLLYASASDGLHIFDISEPSRAQEIGKAPQPETFAYLKRRGRRFLRELSKTDPAAFCEVASAFFAEISERQNLDYDVQWIAADLVAAGHPNYYQASHGRGAYLYKPENFVSQRRVERAPEAWDAHPETLRELAANSVTAPVVHLARQVCAIQAPLTPAQIESYLDSPWPNLRVMGARAAMGAEVLTLSPRAIAGALCVLSASKRRELLERAGATTALAMPAIASELASFLGDSLPIERDKFGRRKVVPALTRRGREIALLLVARFDLSDPAFKADGALPALRALLSAGEAPLRSLGAQFCRRLSAEHVLPLVPFATVNAAVLEALMESAARADFGKEQIDKAVRSSERAARAAAWQLVAASPTSSATLNAVWLSLLRGLAQNYDWSARTITWRISEALQSALSFADARACLVRGALDPSEVRPRWSDEFVGTDSTAYYANAGVPGEVFAAYALFLPPETVVKTIANLTDAKWGEWKANFVAAISPHADIAAGFWRAVQNYLSGKNDKIEQLRARTFNDPAVAATFAGAAGQLPPDLLLGLIATVPDTVWDAWRGALLRVLQSDAARREAFWEAARVQGFEGGWLRARLIDDVDFAATFGQLEADVTQFDDPALEPLLLQWLQARDLDNETLIEAAIHPLPAVRALGLRQLTERGLNVPIALRLLESDLRDAMEAAKNWFNSREENIANLALALCDSPRLRVREYGREFIGARLDALLGDGLLEKLEENPNAEMQGFVADLLLKRENVEAQPLEFDRAVLRGRNRARRAKNLVQTRRAQGAALPDDATLLELARGKTPRDASWALEQLARRALEGEVAGVEVGGVGAI